MPSSRKNITLKIALISIFSGTHALLGSVPGILEKPYNPSYLYLAEKQPIRIRIHVEPTVPHKSNKCDSEPLCGTNSA